MSEYTLTQERKYYEQADLWDRPVDAANRNRIEATLRLVPGDTTSILDLGCGQGVITNHLSATVTTTAFDLSAAALKHVAASARRVQGSGLALPFRDQSFDLVLASEVIEHFPDAEQAAILAEITRVARKYVLIGVPAEEDIAGATVRCTSCGVFYHVNHHYRSYNAAAMERLTGWKLFRLDACGGPRALVHPLLRWLGRRVGGTFETPHALCPTCASPYVVKPSPLPSLALKASNVLWRRMTGRQKLRSHWIALYSKEGQAADLSLGESLSAAASRKMRASSAAYSFGEGLVMKGSVAILLEGKRPSWNPFSWPGSLLRAVRSNANWFVADNLPGLMLAQIASRIRGGQLRYGRNVVFVQKDFQ
jgi:SAM-dependent methyltransferase